MSYQDGQNPYGQQQPGSGASPQQWSGQPVAPVKTTNVAAGILLLLGGLAGVLQALLPWLNNPTGSGGSFSGLDVADQFTATDLTSDTIIGYGIYAILVAGALCVLIGIFMFVPATSHRAVGGLALVLSLVMIVPAIVFLIEKDLTTDGTAVGLYLFLGAGVVALIGSLIGVAKK